MTTATPDRTTGDVEVGYPTYWQIIEGVKDAIEALRLPGIERGRVLHRTLASLEGLPMPCVVVAKTQELFNDLAGTNGADDIGYGVAILLVRSSSSTLDGSSDNVRQLYDWRERIVKAFYNRRPAFRVSSACHLRTQIVSGDPLIPQQWLRNRDAQSLSLRFYYREVRRG